MGILSSILGAVTKSAVPALATISLVGVVSSVYLVNRLEAQKVDAATRLAKVQSVADINAAAVEDQNQKIAAAGQQLQSLQAQLDLRTAGNQKLRQSAAAKAKVIMESNAPAECNQVGTWGAEIAGQLTSQWRKD